MALRLFGGTISFGEMLGYLPVILLGATLPGPMHSVAILFWVLLFPDQARPDDRLWFRNAQFFHVVQRHRGPAISPTGDSGAVRVGYSTSAAVPSIPPCSGPATSQDHERELEKTKSYSDESVHTGWNEVKDAVVAAELAPAELGPPVNPVGIDNVLGKSRRDQDRQESTGTRRAGLPQTIRK